MPALEEYCDVFALNMDELMKEPFTMIVPDTGNPYKQMYVAN